MRNEHDLKGPTRSVIVCSTPRSGSWLLAELLEQTDRCGHPREYFRPDYERTYARAWGLSPTYTFGDYVDEVLRRGSTRNGVFAMKLHWPQYVYLCGRLKASSDARPTDVLGPHFPEPTYVFLRRADKAAQAVSWFRAIRTDRWWDTGASDDTPAPTLDLSAIAELERRLVDQEERWEAALHTDPAPRVDVDYESLSTDYADTAIRVLSLLGQPRSCAPRAPRDLRKQADSLSRAWVRQLLDQREMTR